MSDLHINFYRRWELGTPLEDAFRDLGAAFDWARAQVGSVSELRMGDLLWYGDGGLVGRRITVSEGYQVWRFCFESAREGVVGFEVYNPSSGILSWVKRMYYIMTHGLRSEELCSLRTAYRKDIRVLLGRVVDGDEWDGWRSLLSDFIRVSLPLVCEYMGLVSLQKAFGSESTRRVRYDAGRFSVCGIDYFCEKLGVLFYDSWASLCGSTQPQEVVEMLTWLRMCYESIYRKFIKTLGDDAPEGDELVEAMHWFTDMFVEGLLDVLRRGEFVWSNSLLPQYVRFMD